MKYLLLLLSIAFFSCSMQHEEAQNIVNKAIDVAGSHKIHNSKIEFIFRDKEYGVEQKNGQYEMIRLWENEKQQVVRDEVTNNKFIREINGREVDVADSMAFKYTNSINSVIYFALLPYRLNDEAVNKKYLEEENIKGKDYHKIQITFDQEGGGKDHEDVFIYWINKSSYFIDYFAYSYIVDGGGMRFREAYNQRNINNVRFVDYINYEPVDQSTSLSNLAKAFEKEELKELSKINLTDILVETY